MAKGSAGMKCGGSMLKKYAGGGAINSSAKANSSWGSADKLESMNKSVTKMAKGGKVKNCK